MSNKILIVVKPGHDPYLFREWLLDKYRDIIQTASVILEPPELPPERPEPKEPMR